MKEFFQNLKDIREQKGLSLEDISRRCRLPQKYLRMIEEGRLENLPQGYDRIFFRRYLKEIGEDKPDVWQDFNLFFGSGPYKEDSPYSTDIPQTTATTDAPPAGPKAEKTSFLQDLSLRFNMDRVYRYFWISVTVIVLAVVGYFAYQQYVFLKSSQFKIKEVTVSEFIEEMQKQDTLLTPSMRQASNPAAAEMMAVRVKLVARQRTWVREIRDAQDTTDYIMPVGMERQVPARESVQFVLGRADGVEVWLNNQNLGLMGTSNQIVVRLTLTPDGVAEKRIKTLPQRKVETADSLQPAPAQPDDTLNSAAQEGE